MSIRSGDIVQLRSGGPKMTAGRKWDWNTRVVCYWFKGNEEYAESFPVAALRKVDDERKDGQP